MTAKAGPLLDCPLTVTTTGPLVALSGTVAPILVSFQLVTDAAIPLNVTVPVPCVAPNLVPAMAMVSPTMPEPGVGGVAIAGGGMTVKANGLLGCPTVTIAGPLVAPAGTVALRLVALQLEMAAAVPLNVTVLLPWVAPKPLPWMVTACPTIPAAGVSNVIVGRCGSGTITVEW